MTRIVVLLILLSSSGCSMITGYLRGTDNSIPPAELVPIKNPIAIRKLWETRVGSGTEGAFIKLSPAVEQGRIYAASHDGLVKALNTADGNPLWEVKTKLSISAGVGLGDGLVLVGTDKGQILTLHQETGKEAWRAQVSSESKSRQY